VADLFSGSGGLTCGLEQAALVHGARLDVRLAVEADARIAGVYQRNFPAAGPDSKESIVGDVAEVFSNPVGTRLTRLERAARRAASTVDVLLAGPPCQGHSDLNNRTRRNDPKNSLYLRVARSAEVLEPRVVVIENVPPVQWDRNDVVGATSAALEKLGYTVHGAVVNLGHVGVPQTRKRFVLVASNIAAFDPLTALADIAADWGDHPVRSVRWAIEDLKVGASTFESAPTPQDQNRKRIDYLFDNDVWNLPDEQRPDCHRLKKHSYRSVYGRLWWDKAAPTITTGFGSMGQGRYVHPEQRRTLTPHEAARLQTFPDWFDWGIGTQRTVLATMIGNAVPPLLMARLGEPIVRALGAQPEAKPAA
jgi:DNA (cytosine-5)-methyltransferase 1